MKIIFKINQNYLSAINQIHGMFMIITMQALYTIAYETFVKLCTHTYTHTCATHFSQPLIPIW